MRLSIVFAIAAMSVAAASALPTPAAATDKDEALKLCGQNRNCGIIPGPHNGPGEGVDLSILQSDGTTNIVSCPAKGPCTVVGKPKNGNGKPVAVRGANPVSVIGGTPPTGGGKVTGTATSQPKQLSGTAAKPERIGSAQAASEHPSTTSGAGGSKKH